MNHVITFGEWFTSGATFETLVSVMGKTVLSWVLLFWIARWIYNILVDISNDRKR